MTPCCRMSTETSAKKNSALQAEAFISILHCQIRIGSCSFYCAFSVKPLDFFWRAEFWFLRPVNKLWFQHSQTSFEQHVGTEHLKIPLMTVVWRFSRLQWFCDCCSERKLLKLTQNICSLDSDLCGFRTTERKPILRHDPELYIYTPFQSDGAFLSSHCYTYEQPRSTVPKVEL